MVDPLPDRDYLERQLTKLMSKLLAAYGGHLLEALGDPPNLSNLPASFWENEAAEMLQALRPFGERVYLEAAQTALANLPGGLDWALVNQSAVDWALQWAGGLVKGLEATDMESLRRAIGAYFQSPTPMADLEAQILRLVGSPTRAEMIAVTEVTRAASQGEQAVAKQLAANGINLVPFWYTNRDDLVCPLCGPRDGKPITDGIYPPAHPRCRCSAAHLLPGSKPR